MRQLNVKCAYNMGRLKLSLPNVHVILNETVKINMSIVHMVLYDAVKIVTVKCAYSPISIDLQVC